MPGTRILGRSRGAVIVAGLALAALAVPAGVAAGARPPQTRHARSAPGRPGAGGDGGWAGSWYAAPSWNSTELGSGPVTVRNVVHLSIGGSQVRLRLTNAFGSAPLTIQQVTVALPASSGSTTAAARDVHEVTFGGSAQVTIPAGAEVASDPVSMAVPAGQDLLVSAGVPASSVPATFHLHATQTNFYAAGDGHAADTSASAFTNTTVSWFYVSGVDVRNPAARGSIVTLGDSITDGVTSTPGANDRWPDDLARRLAQLPANRQCGVLNAGISGNRVLLDGSALPGYAAAGQSAVARLQRDVLSRTGVRTLIVYEGINDIIWEPHELNPQAIIAGLRQIAVQAHLDGIRVIGATISPAGGYAEGFDAQQEAVREAVNRWIRDSHVFDAVADFDAVLRDPADPQRIAPMYDSGDDLHPNDAGYAALANALKLDEVC